MAEQPKIILPVIGINGTSAEMLFEGYKRAYAALGDALDAIAAIEFNSRDYAQQDNGWEVWKQAQEAQRARYAAVQHVRDDMLAIAMHCQDHMKT